MKLFMWKSIVSSHMDKYHSQALDEEHVHRLQIISKNTGLELGALIDEGTVFKILKAELKKATSLCNTKEYIVFLNKADTGERLKSAMLISKMLEKLP